MSPTIRTIENLLLKDPRWSAYALADLEPEHEPFCTWSVKDESLLLIYDRLEPPILFMQGEPANLAELLEEVPSGRYQFSCRPGLQSLIKEYFDVESIIDMWRMHLGAMPDLPIDLIGQTVRLNESHLEDIQALFRDHEDAPDAFLPTQLISGVFYGIFAEEHLIAISGTHVRSPQFKLAAIGNVFTDPAQRGNGFASITTKAVVHDLRSQGIEIIVLNVAQSNATAIMTYQRLGFELYCAYFEGHAKRIKR